MHMFLFIFGMRAEWMVLIVSFTFELKKKRIKWEHLKKEVLGTYTWSEVFKTGNKFFLIINICLFVYVTSNKLIFFFQLIIC